MFQVDVLELPAIHNNQEETDTRVVLYLHHVAMYVLVGTIVPAGADPAFQWGGGGKFD